MLPLLAACGARAPRSQLGGPAVVRLPHKPVRPRTTPHTVFIDPGHGGIDWGAKARDAAGDWLAEKTFTLAIGLKTAALLRTAGFRVALSRTTDGSPNQWAVNNPPRDLNGDGLINDIDDVQARINLANAAHAQVLLSIHLNASVAADGNVDPVSGGVLTLWDPDRSFAAQNRLLAGLVQQAMLAVMTATLGHAPHNWGATDDTTIATPFTTSRHGYNHEVELGPSLRGWVHASQMPGVISEPLFLTNPEEQAAVQRPSVQTQLAQGYVRAIQAFVAGAHTLGS